MYRLLILFLTISLTTSVAAQDEMVAADRSEGPSPDASLNSELQALATTFFEWRRQQQPISANPLRRVERSPGWAPDYSPENLAVYRFRYKAFLDQLQAIDQQAFTRHDQVDFLLLESAIKRVGWELDVIAAAHRNPFFYLHQTLGSLYELFLDSSPFTSGRMDEFILRLESFERTLVHARINLDRPVQPFAIATIERLQDIDTLIKTLRKEVKTGLTPQTYDSLPKNQKQRISDAFDTALTALTAYREWLREQLQDMESEFAIGESGLQWYLANIALAPYSTGELRDLAEQGYAEANTLLAIEQNRNRETPEPVVLDSQTAQVRMASYQLGEIRNFVTTQQLLTVPPDLPSFEYRPLPAILDSLGFLGPAIDYPQPLRQDESAVRYIPEPASSLPYPQLTAAIDPRPALIHEGFPGHWAQLVLSRMNPDPVRRNFVDESANEGIAFYMEEMLLQAGLFSFSPRTREMVYQLKRLRGLLVDVDIKLATGLFDIEAATEFLARTFPMERQQAADLATGIAMNPGSGLSHQVGKSQVMQFLSDAKDQQGEAFSLQAFHDYLLGNGNLPVALQQLDYLDLGDNVDRLETLTGQPVTVPN